ncbi:ATP-grasp domain-containing protein [Vibrio sp. AK197]
MTKTSLTLDKQKLHIFKENTLDKLRVLLIEGTHSEENLSYKNHPSSPERGIISIIEAFNRLNLNYKLVESTNRNLINNVVDTDLVFPYAHGEYGEDGRLQGLLDYANVPYVSSGVLGSAICSDKLTFKRIIRQANIPTANFFDLSKEKTTQEILFYADAIGYPVMAKLRNGGSSIGIYKINNREELVSWLVEQDSRENYFIEKWISGRFVTVGIMKSEQKIQHLPLLEVTTESEFYDAKQKLGVEGNNSPEFIINPELTQSESTKIINASYRAFEVCNCKSIVRLDFIIDDEQNPHLLEINTIPGIAKNSNLTSMFYSLGYSYDEMILEIIHSAFTE